VKEAFVVSGFLYILSWIICRSHFSARHTFRPMTKAALNHSKPDKLGNTNPYSHPHPFQPAETLSSFYQGFCSKQGNVSQRSTAERSDKGNKTYWLMRHGHIQRQPYNGRDLR
jgi:hypothetical protein